MKRLIFIFLAAMMSTALCSAAMSNSRVRKETRFLTDKMAYELNLNTEQYNDVYEINYDFISSIGNLMDDVMYGQEWALNRYYDNLDVRNDDLRWVLSSRQYSRFMQAAYFYRPIYVNGGNWSFRIYITYSNHNHFYFPRPYHYRTYCGGHYRSHYHNTSYYRGRYNHSVYTGVNRIRDDRSYTTTRRSDFGSVNIRPNSSTRPTRNESSRNEPSRRNESTRRNSSSSNRENVNSSSRPSTSGSSSTRRNSGESSSTRKSNSESTRTKDNNRSSRSSSSNSTRVGTDSGSTRRSSSTSTRSSSSSSSGNSSSRSSEGSPRR